MRDIFFRHKYDDDGRMLFCEYSGIDDKNGKKIYEGDIVNGLFQFGLPFSSVCTFKNGAFGVEWKHGNGIHFQPFAGFYGVEFEVIGNVWDNPELKEDEG